MQLDCHSHWSQKHYLHLYNYLGWKQFRLSHNNISEFKFWQKANNSAKQSTCAPLGQAEVNNYPNYKCMSFNFRRRAAHHNTALISNPIVIHSTWLRSTAKSSLAFKYFNLKKNQMEVHRHSMWVYKNTLFKDIDFVMYWVWEVQPQRYQTDRRCLTIQYLWKIFKHAGLVESLLAASSYEIFTWGRSSSQSGATQQRTVPQCSHHTLGFLPLILHCKRHLHVIMKIALLHYYT